MGLAPKLSRLLLICAMFMLLPSVRAQIADKAQGNAAAKQSTDFTRAQSQLRVVKSGHGKRLDAVGNEDDDYDDDEDEDGHKYRSDCDVSDYTDSDGNADNIHKIDIKTINVDDEEAKPTKSDRGLKQAIRQLMKFDDNVVAERQPNRIETGPGLDFRREFASDEANPYI
ncbi:uncharacterized protein LOC111593997 [Drosophila hydei]|uniref:Uncharacterized protein LOC111593997 n=1 Tax=Drosophila hydei TaxID=7224 RepID=A0A6J1LHP9_DROHY|nr:uncharacterized protein LOC111593997 [Drosophila hydei]